MRMYLIRDNTDTLTGMRLAGVDGVIANEKETLEKALNEVLKDKNIGPPSCSVTVRNFDEKRLFMFCAYRLNQLRILLTESFGEQDDPDIFVF